MRHIRAGPLLVLLALSAAILSGYAGRWPDDPPLGGSPIYQAKFWLSITTPVVDDCLAADHSYPNGACVAAANLRQVAVDVSAAYSSVDILQTTCFYEDGTLIITDDEMTVCVAYRVDDTMTNTSSCVTLVSSDQTADTTNIGSDSTPENIAATQFGLALRITAFTDVGSVFRGSCVVQYQGSED